MFAIASNLITYFQAIVLGVLQGVTELFPVSSLGHTVIFPNLFGWNNIVAWQSQPESPWLAFVVMLHVGSAIGLLIYFWRDWVAIVTGFFRTIRKRRIDTPTERLAWLILVATIPVGILGAGLLKFGDLTGPLGQGIRGPAVVAAIAAAITAVFTVAFLTRYFKTRTLIPFAIYCVVFGLAMVIYNA